MDPREIARKLGILSIEERVQIIQCLLEVGSEGLEMPDIAVKTGLGAPAIVKQIEALMVQDPGQQQGLSGQRARAEGSVRLHV